MYLIQNLKKISSRDLLKKLQYTSTNTFSNSFTLLLISQNTYIPYHAKRHLRLPEPTPSLTHTSRARLQQPLHIDIWRRRKTFQSDTCFRIQLKISFDPCTASIYIFFLSWKKENLHTGNKSSFFVFSRSAIFRPRAALISEAS